MENMTSIELTFLAIAVLAACFALWSNRDKIKNKFTGGSSGRKGADKEQR